MALVAQATEQAHNAQRHITQALYLASDEGFVRLFLDEGSTMQQLLANLLTAHASTREQRIAMQYARSLLEQTEPGCSTSAQEALLDPLSEHEREILQLLAAGKSNIAIARELFLALSTVKWHIGRLYSKLDVHTRTQAIASARELKLLDT